MVQLIKTGKVLPESQLQRDKMASVKVEDNDLLEEQHSPLNKRSKLSTSLPPHNLGIDGSPVSTSQFNPLEEPSPLGLRLKKSPSLLDLIQMKLSQGNASEVRSHSKKEAVPSSCTIDKLKASNFPASLLRIGTWEYKSKYEGDLVAKCYFAKHKLVWEVLDGGLKNKIEIQWSDIMALKANYSDVGPESLDVVLARQPLFFRETNPQPRKHTLWHSTSDFTGGQASVHRRHYMECPQGLLAKHFEKLIQCDPRLNYLSQQAEITLVSPYFDPGVSGVDDSNELNSGYDFDGGPSIFDLHDAASPSGTQSSSSKNEQHEFIGRHLEHFSRETPSPSSVMDTSVIEEIRSHGALENCLSSWDQIKVPGIHHSMSMCDLVSHIENQISEHRTADDPNLSNEERQSLVMLEEISRWLFTDFPPASTSDENSVMSRVDSLCCLLQKDPVTFPDLPIKSENGADKKMEEDISASEGNCGAEDSPTREGESNDVSGC